MSVIPDSTKTFDQLEEFKGLLQGPFKKTIKEKYGLDFYTLYVKEPLEDFLVNVEASIELAAERSIRDEELQYDPEFIGE